MPIKAKNSSYDLYAEVQQTICDKFLGSVKYPFKVLEQRQEFPKDQKTPTASNGLYKLSKEEISTLLKNSLNIVKGKKSSNSSIHSQVFSFAGSVIQQAKNVIDAAKSAEDKYQGPDIKEMQKIVDDGIEGLVNTLGDFDIYFWCSYLSVKINKQPKLSLASPVITLNDIKIEVTATGEIWAKYPWLNCYKWCTQWEKIHKFDRIASLTVSPELKVKAHADLSLSGTILKATATIDELRLNYDILDKIPLEGIANTQLGDSPIFVFDASKLLSTVPLLESKFIISSIILPPSSTSIGIGILFKQL